ncbi:hypothetical protein RvY_15422 [Ramazzottius varieornatus]|uniref:p53 and DNA damage-regulated protein 1 n=1 Tax=Ramazzottius varieornatus TaxID=947166 RepID=A0A1D1W1P4_RAMVA|nr:hypothetical protein RvY_15422 [Ramazzottius varieornatus]
MEEVSTEALMNVVVDVEKLGDEIIADRYSIIDMDRIRNKNREALSAIRKPSELMKKEEHVWMNIGDLFIRTSKDQLGAILDEDQKYLDNEINKLRDNLKPKVAKMNTALGKPEVKGFDLQRLSKEEMDAVRQAMG